MIWTAVANHLWQSTLFLLAVAALALLFRKNQARVRCGLWLAASFKFVLPFSLLIGLGSALEGHLATPRRVLSAPVAMYSTAQQVSQPFTQNAKPGTSPSRFRSLTGKVLMAVWLFGCLAVAYPLVEAVETDIPQSLRGRTRSSKAGKSPRCALPSAWPACASPSR